jgi:hypothetical protein
VHDTRLVIKPDGALDIKQLTGAADGAYTVALAGKFGFDAIREPEPVAARVIVPHIASWSVAQLPHQPAISGESFDPVVSSAAAPCLPRAEIPHRSHRRTRHGSGALERHDARRRARVF